ncbi:MAG: putative 2OG-Fe(II) oxygenase, partial [Rhodopila sp.]
MLAAALSTIESGHIEQNLRSGQLIHTTVADPKGHPVFEAMAARAMPKLVEFGQLLFGDALQWTVKEMWTNVLETGGTQALHAHANSFASGIFYLTPSDPGCRTVFVRPPGGFDFSFRHHTRSA